MKEFRYLKPESLPEAISLAAQFGSKSAFLAGGTDLVVQMKRKVKSPSYVINLKGISELSHINFNNGKGLSIGPLVTHNALSDHPIILEKYPFLAEAARLIGTYQVRERGTIGGNICNGSPAADTIPPLICLGAKLRLQSLEKDTITAIEDFFEGPQKTKLGHNEILTAIQIPPLSPHTGTVYLKLGVRKALEIAVVGVAILIALDKTKKTCLNVKIALASVAPTPLACRRAEGVLAGKQPEERIIEQAARVAQEEATPITDVRGTAEYRREMVYLLTKKALNQAIHRAIEQDK